MTYFHVELTVICDDCGRKETYQSSFLLWAKAKAREAGWHIGEGEILVPFGIVGEPVSVAFCKSCYIARNQQENHTNAVSRYVSAFKECTHRQ